MGFFYVLDILPERKSLRKNAVKFLFGVDPVLMGRYNLEGPAPRAGKIRNLEVNAAKWTRTTVDHRCGASDNKRCRVRFFDGGSV